MEPPEIDEEQSLLSIIISFVIAITLILILIKFRWKFLMKGWFFVVVILALAISFNAILKSNFTEAALIALLLAVPLAFFKIYRQSFLVHNLTELFVYPGIAAVFVPILGVWSILVLLVLISIYDLWAVWHSGVMQKMAKFQIEELKLFAGFFVPYVSKKMKLKIQLLKQKYKNNKKGLKKEKIKVNLAVLGGGDVVFPIITAGVFLRAFGIVPALFVIGGAFTGLTYLFLTLKKKAYPAMIYIVPGIFLGLLVWRLLVF